LRSDEVIEGADRWIGVVRSRGGNDALAIHANLELLERL